MFRKLFSIACAAYGATLGTLGVIVAPESNDIGALMIGAGVLCLGIAMAMMIAIEWESRS